MKDVKFWRYYLPNVDGEGWGTFILDSTGMFAAVTDYGNCAYRWVYHGEDDFRKFFRGDSWDYYLEKLFGGRQEYNQKSTLHSVKERILYLRWERRISEDTARTEWDLLEHHDDLYSSVDFTRWYDETRLDDAGEYYTRDYTASAKALCYKLLPRLFKVIQEELERENVAA